MQRLFYFCFVLMQGTYTASAIDFDDFTTVQNRQVIRSRAEYLPADDYQQFAIAEYAMDPSSNSRYSNATNWNAAYLYEPRVGRPEAVPAPTVIFVHGGAWTSGSPQQFEPFAGYLAELGMPTFSVGYGLQVGPNNLMANDPGQYVIEATRDIRSAIRWVRENSTELNIDPDQIYLAGGSAGGHLSLMASLSQDTLFDTPEDNLSIPYDVSGHLLFNPVVQTTSPGGFGSGGISSHYGTGFDVDSLSPITQVADLVVDALMMHGVDDTLIPIETARAFRDIVNLDPSHNLQLTEYAGQGHGFFNSSPSLEQTRDEMVSWLQARTISVPEPSSLFLITPALLLITPALLAARRS